MVDNCLPLSCSDLVPPKAELSLIALWLGDTGKGKGNLLNVTQSYYCFAAAVMPLRQHSVALKSFTTLRSGLDLLYKCCPGVLYHRLVLHSTPWDVIYSTAFLCTVIVKSVVIWLIHKAGCWILFTQRWLCSTCLCCRSPLLLQLCSITVWLRVNESRSQTLSNLNASNQSNNRMTWFIIISSIFTDLRYLTNPTN